MAGSGVTPSSSSGLTSRDYWGLGLAGASMVPMLFAHGGSIDEPLKGLQEQAERAKNLSKVFGEQGTDLLGPAADYLKNVLGDRQALLAATMPERRKVIDQYATAKKAIAEFTPRGGGQAGGMLQLEANKASDLASVGIGARRSAVDTAANVGTSLAGLGLNAEALASGDLNAIIQAIQQRSAQSGANAAGFGQAVGMLAGLLLL